MIISEHLTLHVREVYFEPRKAQHADATSGLSLKLHHSTIQTEVWQSTETEQGGCSATAWVTEEDCFGILINLKLNLIVRINISMYFDLLGFRSILLVL